MTPAEYKKKVLAELKAEAKQRGGLEVFRNPQAKSADRVRSLEKALVLEEKKDLQLALRIAANRAENAALRVACIARLNHSEPAIEALIELIGDTTETAEVRSAALSSLKAAGFAARHFSNHRVAYMAALHKAVDSDDNTLRRRALGVLARARDRGTRKRLIKGLREESDALVEPEKALQLLSYDMKDDLGGLLHQIVERPPTEGSRLQALRMLAADGTSKPLFEKVLNDRNESGSARRIAIAALNSIEPASLQKRALDLVNDETEDDDVRAACLVAAAHLKGGNDDALRIQARELGSKSKSSAVRAAAKAYLTKATK